MRRVKIAEHVKSGETVWNGYVGGETTCTAPDDPGLYTLFELAYENTNTHAGWEWFKEEKVVANDESGLLD